MTEKETANKHVGIKGLWKAKGSTSAEIDSRGHTISFYCNALIYPSCNNLILGHVLA